MAIDPTPYGIVLVMASSQVEAEQIAWTLVQNKLAAGVSITPTHSIYTWQGQIESKPEWQLLIKTDLGCFAAIEEIVRRLHSYVVPEIVALPMLAGSPDYFAWIRENTLARD